MLRDEEPGSNRTSRTRSVRRARAGIPRPAEVDRPFALHVVGNVGADAEDAGVEADPAIVAPPRPRDCVVS